MPLNLNDFKKGLKHWQNETYWPRDFHNRFYAELKRINKKGQFTPQWWNAILPHLNYWKATRPKKARDLTKRANERFFRLEETWESVAKSPHTIANEESCWESLEAFTKVVAEIKKIKSTSPVFSSKMCHFSSPTRFPVIDKTAMKSSNFKTYKDYWKFVKKTWGETSLEMQQKLKQLLKKEVKRNTGDKLISGFPYACKITEICLIGRTQK